MSGPNAAPAPNDEPDQRPSILVVGGTGHVGAPLCNFLLERGHHVTAASRSDRLVFESPAINRIQFDVTNLNDPAPLPRSTTAIICPWVDDPNETASPWIGHLLKRLTEVGLDSIIYFSTMWVYGVRPHGLLTESTPAASTNSYGTAHHRNESILTEYSQDLGLDVSILRMANLVGPDPFYRSRSKISFVHELVEMAVKDQSIVLRFPPSTPRNLLTRTLLHHDLAALCDRQTVESRVDVFNLGSGSTTTLVEVARQIAHLGEGYHGRPVRVEHPGEPITQPTFHLDTTRIRSLAGPGPDDLAAELQLVLEDVVKSHTPVNKT